MLGIHGVGRHRADYYLSDLGPELPAPEPGRWAGAAAAGLGLEGSLEAADFHRLLQGRHPRTGRPIGSGRTTVAAFDLTFTAPKSVSVVFALGGEAAARCVVATHIEAVEGALSYLERYAVTAARREGAERFVIPTTGVVAGQFTHAVSRSGDPHLHSHVVMANVVHGTDGRWSACDRRGMEAHRQAASAVYGAHLRAGLTSGLGVSWSAVPGRSTEIVGVGPHLVGAFSTRGADIRRHGHEVGVRSRRGGRVAWAATRPAKSAGSPYADAVAEWERRARASDGPLPLVLEPRRRERGAEGRARLDEHRFAGELSLTPHGGARRRDVVVAFGAAATDGVSAGSLERLVGHWVPRGPDRGGRTAATAPGRDAREPSSAGARSPPRRSRGAPAVGRCRTRHRRLPGPVGPEPLPGVARRPRITGAVLDADGPTRRLRPHDAAPRRRAGAARAPRACGGGARPGTLTQRWRPRASVRLRVRTGGNSSRQGE